jgi:hypothetical protein
MAFEALGPMMSPEGLVALSRRLEG